MKIAETAQLFRRRRASVTARKHSKRRVREVLSFGLFLSLCIATAWLLTNLPFVPVLG
ncbi:hypothetical protein Q4485_14610 [Granulosicoccaceae sp. 1_MG-2023]|nr:hypothetical protein [Granulosicoccaceae sp. 1_MG-2023]